MRRKIWAIKELCGASKDIAGILIHAATVWNVRADTNLATRRERSADLDARIANTPLRYAWDKANVRGHRAMLALLVPKTDAALLSLESTFAKFGAGKKLIAKLERAVLRLPEID